MTAELLTMRNNLRKSLNTRKNKILTENNEAEHQEKQLIEVSLQNFHICFSCVFHFLLVLEWSLVMIRAD